VQDPHSFPGEVDRFNLNDQHAGSMQHLPERLDDIGNCHVTSGDFVQHGRKENEILPRRQHDFHIRNSDQSPLQVQRCVGARKAAAENQDASRHDVPMCRGIGVRNSSRSHGTLLGCRGLDMAQTSIRCSMGLGVIG
jgi:hypothetical protein